MSATRGLDKTHNELQTQIAIWIACSNDQESRAIDAATQVLWFGSYPLAISPTERVRVLTLLLERAKDQLEHLKKQSINPDIIRVPGMM